MGEDHIRSPQDGLLASIPAQNNVVQVLSDGLRHSPLSKMAGVARRRQGKMVLDKGNSPLWTRTMIALLTLVGGMAVTSSGQKAVNQGALKKYVQEKIVKPGHCLPECQVEKNKGAVPHSSTLHIPDKKPVLKAYLANADTVWADQHVGLQHFLNLEFTSSYQTFSQFFLKHGQTSNKLTLNLKFTSHIKHPHIFYSEKYSTPQG